MLYKFIISVDDNSSLRNFEIDREFENEFGAKNELKNIGTNGLMVVIPDSGGNIEYYPPGKILKIHLTKA